MGYDCRGNFYFHKLLLRTIRLASSHFEWFIFTRQIVQHLGIWLFIKGGSISVISVLWGLTCTDLYFKKRLHIILPFLIYWCVYGCACRFFWYRRLSQCWGLYWCWYNFRILSSSRNNYLLRKEIIYSLFYISKLHYLKDTMELSGLHLTGSSPRRPLFLHAMSFEWTTKL